MKINIPNTILLDTYEDQYIEIISFELTNNTQLLNNLDPKLLIGIHKLLLNNTGNLNTIFNINMNFNYLDINNYSSFIIKFKVLNINGIHINKLTKPLIISQIGGDEIHVILESKSSHTSNYGNNIVLYKIQKYIIYDKNKFIKTFPNLRNIKNIYISSSNIQIVNIILIIIIINYILIF